MHASIEPLPSSPEPGGQTLDDLEARMSSLKAGALAGVGAGPLQGLNIGVVCGDPQRPEVFMLERAAGELGARVALVQPGLEMTASPSADERAGKVLGMLYDALICIDLPAWLVRVLRDSSGIPAADDLAGRWVALQSQRLDIQDDHRFLLMALMLDACA